MEVFHNTGVALSASHSQDPDNPQIASNLYVMSWPRPALYDRINLRTDLMARNGLIDEVGNYIAKGYSRENPAIKALGYRELISALDQEIPIDHAIEVMKKKSRNYAKRQETWFRAMKEARWISCEDATTCETASCFAEDWEKSTG